MTTIKPSYLNLKELSEDSLSLIEEYLNGIDVERFSIRELTQLAPVLIDIFSATWSSLPSDERCPLAYRVYTTALSLISECISELEKVRNEEELTRPSDYTATIRALNKLNQATNRLTKNVKNNTIDTQLSPSELENIGISLNP